MRTSFPCILSCESEGAEERFWCCFVEEEDIPEIQIELYLLDKLKARIQLARQIDNAQHKIKKANHEKNWLKEAAEAMEIEVDSDMGLRYVSHVYFRRANVYGICQYHIVTMTTRLSRSNTSVKMPTRRPPGSKPN